jgi:16S rRNA (cytosine967-C5)-methyltransferase
LAWDVLWRTWKHGAYPDLLLSSLLAKASHMAKPDRGLAQELVFGTLRWQGSLDRGLERTSDRSLSRIPPRLLILLRLGVYQLLYLDRIPPAAAVNETVEMARGLGFAHAVPFVNAVLRAIERGGRDLLAVDPALPPTERMAQETSHPRWMVERWIGQWGAEETRALCEAHNEVPPVTLRTNTLKVSRGELSGILEEEGVRTEATRFSSDGLRVLRLPGPLGSLGSFRRGVFHVQDEASQLLAGWLEAKPGDRILDACAAPGGKSTHLAQLMGNRGKVAAVDTHEGRLNLIGKECLRLGITCVETLRADLTDPGAVPQGPFDRVLLDAPCTGLGVIRRHPDAKWRRTPQDPERLAAIQISLLRNLLPILRSGGTLLYSVCTHTPEEADGVLAQILREAPGLRLLRSPDGLPSEARGLVGADGIFRSFPHRHGMDGFTAFRLIRV